MSTRTSRRGVGSAMRLLAAFGLGVTLALFAAQAPRPAQPGEGGRPERGDRPGQRPVFERPGGAGAGEGRDGLTSEDLREHLEGLMARLDTGEPVLSVARDLCMPMRRLAEDRGPRVRRGPDAMGMPGGPGGPEGLEGRDAVSAPPGPDVALSDADRETIQLVLRSVDGEKAKELDRLRELDPERHARLMLRLREEFWGIISLRQENPTLFGLRVRELSARRRAGEVALTIARAELAGRSGAELHDQYATLREHLTEVHRLSLATAENEWERVRQKLDERSLNIDQYVENDVEVLVRVVKEQLTRADNPRWGGAGGGPGAGGPGGQGGDPRRGGPRERERSPNEPRRP